MSPRKMSADPVVINAVVVLLLVPAVVVATAIASVHYGWNFHLIVGSMVVLSGFANLVYFVRRRRRGESLHRSEWLSLTSSAITVLVVILQALD